MLQVRILRPTRSLVRFEAGLWCNSSISAREADGPGANPGFLTIFDGPLVVDYRTQNETNCRCSSTATEQPNASSGDAGSRPAIRFLNHSTSCPSTWPYAPCASTSDMLWSLGYWKKPFIGEAGSKPVQLGNRLTTHLASCPSSFKAGPLARSFLMGRRYRVIGYWFESNSGLQTPR